MRTDYRGRARLLFVTYSFPPAKSIGAVRTWNIAKHLARSGWAVTVLTPDATLWRHVESVEVAASNLQREGVERLSTDHRWRWLMADRVKCSNRRGAWIAGGILRRAAQRLGIDRTVGWVGPAERTASRLTAGDVDLVLSSGPPFSAFPLARRLAKRFGCPLVLDYRDLWSHHLYRQAPRTKRREASVLANAAAVTTVSRSWAAVLDREFGVGGKSHVISNGYDPEDLALVEPYEFGHFAIVYAGSLWPPKRVISPVMAAMRRMKDRSEARSPWRFHYFGRHDSHVRQEARRFGVDDHVEVHGNVPRARALAAVKGAGVAVVITSVAESATIEDRGMVTGKMFEAVGLGTPALVIAPPGSDANVVAETAGHARAFTATDVEGIATFLVGVMEGKAPRANEPEAYAWEHLVQGLDRILRGTLG